MKKYTILFLMGLIFSIKIHAQTPPPNYVPTITPKAPDAAALMKFTDVPVSPYTGSSSVTVPIYTIKVKGMMIPISVDYHTGGIRLEEEASSVGLGWALTASGMITRTINDKDDLGGLYFGSTVPQPQGNLIAYQPANGPPISAPYGATDSLLNTICPTCSFYTNCVDCPIAANRYIFDFQCSYDVNFTTGGTNDFINVFGPVGDDHPYDLEPDSYSYNFLGHSGKFILKRLDSTVVLEKQDNLNIKVVQPKVLNGNITFQVTDDNGNKFYFATLQSTHPAWASGDTPTSWYLSQITTQQSDKIIFSYGGAGYTTVGPENTQSYYAFSGHDGPSNQSNANTTFNNVNLKKIDYPDGQVQFFLDSLRTDIQNGYKLDSIRVFSKTTAGLKYLKSDKFYYTYFQPGGTITNAYEVERLRLDSVKEISGGLALKPYSFAYNGYPAAYPEKHSFAIDHWGYYNGAGNTILIPSMSIYYPGNGFDFAAQQFTYTGANREPSFPNSQCFSLRKVIYPTGGSSIFNYEANTYDYNKSISQQVDNPQQVVVDRDTTIYATASMFTSAHPDVTGTFNLANVYPKVGTTGTANLTITVTFKSNDSSSGWSSFDKTNGNGLYFTYLGNTTFLSSSGLTCMGPQCSVSYSITVNPSDAPYTWTAHYDPSGNIPVADFDQILIRYQFKELQTVAQSSPTLTAGGLRIASIVDSTATGIAKKRTWNYHYGSTNQYTNGLLMSFPSYARLEEESSNLLNPGGGGHLGQLVLFSSSNTPVTSAIQGNIVGYSHVTETIVDPSNSADNGKIVYSYVNTPDSVISYSGFRYPGIPNMGNNLNGSEISRITYRNTGSAYWKIAETDSYYHTTNRAVYYSAKYKSSVDDNKQGTCSGGTPVSNAGIAQFFPSIKSERVLQDSVRNITYDPADTTKSLLTSTKNYYDNTKHYQVTRSKMVDSKGNTHVTKITYPQDYISSGTTTGNAVLDSLIAKNMIEETIEKRDSLYYPSSSGNVIAATENRYKQLSSGTMVQDKVYKLDIVKPVNNFQPLAVSGGTLTHDSRYRQLISFDTYDSNNNIVQYTLTNELPVSIIWDYKKMSPIAQVKNGTQADIAYTSFEAEGTGNWTIGSATRDSTTAAITGVKSYNLTSGNISKSGLTSGTTYVVSYWTKSTSPLTITGTITGYPIVGATLNGWTYHEHLVTGQTTITLSGTGNIDEVRLYPQNAQMTSYTYQPQIGVSSITDARDGITYYEYDAFQRLMNIRDQNGNIVKNFVYHYAGQ